MPSKPFGKTKIVLDTNNLVSAQINTRGHSHGVYKLLAGGTVVIYTSPFQTKELKRVLNYTRIKKKYKLSSQKIEEFVRLFKKNSIQTYPTKISNIIKNDADDNHILAIAEAGKVDFIISGDRHLLNLKKFKNILIITAKEFLMLK